MSKWSHSSADYLNMWSTSTQSCRYALGLWSQTDQVQVPALPLGSCVTLGKLLDLSESRFPYLHVGCLYYLAHRAVTKSEQSFVILSAKHLSCHREATHAKNPF